MGFSAMVDRMMWPPALSRDRKWPRVGLTKCTHWREVGLRLEDNLVLSVYGKRSQGISQFYLHTRVHPLTEWTIPAFAFPVEAGTHLPTPEGWKVELALGGWLVTYRNKNVRHRELNPDTVAHLSTNRARRRLISLIEASLLISTPDHSLFVSLCVHYVLSRFGLSTTMLY